MQYLIEYLNFKCTGLPKSSCLWQDRALANVCRVQCHCNCGDNLSDIYNVRGGLLLAKSNSECLKCKYIVILDDIGCVAVVSVHGIQCHACDLCRGFARDNLLGVFAIYVPGQPFWRPSLP